MINTLILACALGCGLMAGFFFAFSVLVMRALGRLPPEQGIAAMQTINVVVINPWFLVTFLGTALLCVVTMIGAFVRAADTSAYLSVAASVLYLFGTVGVTMWFNVPRNNALAAVAPSSAEGARVWASYVPGWTAWNHVRTLAAAAATALFVLAERC